MTRRTPDPPRRVLTAIAATRAQAILDAQRRLNLRHARHQASGDLPGPSDPRHVHLTQPHD